MSEYWSATSGTALVFQKEEVRDFFTRYLLETYRKDGVTDRDIDFIDCTISEYGSDSFYFLLSAFCIQTEPTGSISFSGILCKRKYCCRT